MTNKALISIRSLVLCEHRFLFHMGIPPGKIVSLYDCSAFEVLVDEEKS